MDAQRALVDWRSVEPYAALQGCGRHSFAWEWLRRSPRYLAASCAAREDGTLGRQAERFGLHGFEDPNRATPVARPIWRAEADPYVLAVEARCGEDDDDLFEIVRFGSLATCHVGPEGREHWLLSDGWQNIRLDIVRGTLGHGPVQLAYHLVGVARLSPQLATMTRLVALDRSGRLAPRLFPAERRAHRWALVLRTRDALMVGASQREIAEVVFDLGALPRWRIEAPSYRQRVQRLAETARAAAAADPRRWLSGAFP